MSEERTENKEQILEVEKASQNTLREKYTFLKENHPLLFFVSNMCLSFAFLMTAALIITGDYSTEIPSPTTTKIKEKPEPVVQIPQSNEEEMQEAIYNYLVSNIGITATQNSFQDETKARLFTTQLQAISALPSYSFLVYEMQLLQKMEQMRLIPITQILASFPSNQSRYNYLDNYINQAITLNTKAIDAVANIASTRNAISKKSSILNNQKKNTQERIDTVSSANQYESLAELINESEKINQEIALLKQRDKLAQKVQSNITKSQKLLNARILGTESNKDILAHQFKVNAVSKMNLDIIDGNLKRSITSTYKKEVAQTTQTANTSYSNEIPNESPKRFGINVVGSRMANGDIYIPFAQKEIPKLQLPRIPSANSTGIGTAVATKMIQSKLPSISPMQRITNFQQNQEVPQIQSFSTESISGMPLGSEIGKLNNTASFKDNFTNLFAGGKYLK